jgi:Toastrack DUF4097
MTARTVVPAGTLVATAFLAGLALTACDGLSAMAGFQRAEGTFERRLSVSGAASVDISTGSGAVIVRSGPAGSVVVQGRVTAHDGFGSSIDPDERVRRIAANPPVEQSGREIRIGRIDDEDLRQNVSIAYTVTVPAETSLVSRTGSGSQDVEGLRGAIEITAGSGSIHVTDAGGSVRASTGSGAIVADRVAGTFDANAGSGSIQGTGVNGAVTVKTGSGRITVSQTGPGDVHASAGSGSIELSGVRGGVRAATGSGSLTVRGEQISDWDLSTSSGSVAVELSGAPAFTLDAHSSGGRIETSYPVTVTGTMERNALRGSVNGGGPLLRLRTSSGSIRLR